MFTVIIITIIMTSPSSWHHYHHDITIITCFKTHDISPPPQHEPSRLITGLKQLGREVNKQQQNYLLITNTMANTLLHLTPQWCSFIIFWNSQTYLNITMSLTSSIYHRQIEKNIINIISCKSYNDSWSFNPALSNGTELLHSWSGWKNITEH